MSEAVLLRCVLSVSRLDLSLMNKVPLSLMKRETISASNTGMTPSRNGSPLNRPPCRERETLVSDTMRDKEFAIDQNQELMNSSQTEQVLIKNISGVFLQC